MIFNSGDKSENTGKVVRLARARVSRQESTFWELLIMAWQERNDNVPGWVYLLQAEGYHGYIPGVYLRRMKIGLTRSVENRLDTLHSSQPPCNYKVVRAIYVENMAVVEDSLHNQFKHRNVKLIKSREWFDLLPHQYAMVLWMFSRYDSKRNHTISPRLIAGGLVALLGVGLLIGSTLRNTELQPQNDVIQPSVTKSKK